MAVTKREVQSCIENVQSMRGYILSLMQLNAQLRPVLEPMIRKDLNSLATKLDYILSMSEANT
jgi:hypothetical protein